MGMREPVMKPMKQVHVKCKEAAASASIKPVVNSPSLHEPSSNFYESGLMGAHMQSSALQFVLGCRTEEGQVWMLNMHDNASHRTWRLLDGEQDYCTQVALGSSSVNAFCLRRRAGLHVLMSKVNSAS